MVILIQPPLFVELIVIGSLHRCICNHNFTSFLKLIERPCNRITPSYPLCAFLLINY